jgi:hydroxymethylglutaryl-CoA lyase
VGEGPQLRCHFHNTRNTGLANALAAVEAGVRVLDSSLGGIGGCPFAPAATGNIPTEDLVYLLERSGVSTGVDLDALIGTVAWLEGALGHPTPGLLARAGTFPRPAPEA